MADVGGGSVMSQGRSRGSGELVMDNIGGRGSITQDRGRGCEGRGRGCTGRGHVNFGCGSCGRDASRIIRDILPNELSVFLNGWEEVTEKFLY